MLEKNIVNKWKKTKLFKIDWNGEKISRKYFFLLFSPPPQKKLFGGCTTICRQKWKKSKLPEMARKLVGNNFGFFRCICVKRTNASYIWPASYSNMSLSTVNLARHSPIWLYTYLEIKNDIFEDDKHACVIEEHKFVLNTFVDDLKT